ncbi:hypothetical protein MSG28_004145 [Choristoneura fumiferana]|uniref:Uncharacterized protein n=1 Tax=Choristoneura fumiferana TaxID=7141 RepID=A0ACC0KHP0_CHOFU|nr:hypothetical protein MSG28_004145 [Choristoneura fumiferana]
MVRKKLVPEERPICNVVAVYRTRGNYLQRLEQFDKAIQSYNEALRWNSSDVRSLLGRSLARAKATYYAGALADAARAAELEPENLTALQIRAQTEYEKCAFERSLVLAHRGRFLRKLPPDFAECARHAEETVRDCTGSSAGPVLQSAIALFQSDDLKRDSTGELAPKTVKRRSRMLRQDTHQVQEISRVEKQKKIQMARLMASKYLQRMAHDKYFLVDLCKDERLASANKKGSMKLQELANNALADVENRQCVLRERRPMYAARASEAAARARLYQARRKQLARAQKQNITDAQRLVHAVAAVAETQDTLKCLEQAEFAMEQISRKPPKLLPGKEKFLQQLHDIVGLAFLDQKRVTEQMSEADRETKAFIMLGIAVSREPSRDSLLRMRPLAPPRDAKSRLRTLDRALKLSVRAAERCYLLHELARLYVDTKQAHKARFYSIKCQAEARGSGQWVWLLNATFLLARGHVLQNNRPEGRAALLEGAALARSFKFDDVSEFFDTCATVATEGELLAGEASLEKREKAMVSLMQDDDLRSAAQHLFKRMSTVPAARRFSIMPGTHPEDTTPTAGRRASIMPRGAQPARLVRKAHLPLGFQDFDN